MSIQQKSFWRLMAIFIVSVILTPMVIHATTLGNPYSYNNELNLIPMFIYAKNEGTQMSIYARNEGTQSSITIKSNTDLGFRLDLGLGFPYFFGNKSMKDHWKSMVPSSEYDTLDWLNIMFDINLSIRVYRGLSIGAFYSLHGPEINKTITWTSSGYWYYYYGRWYWIPPGQWDEHFALSFNNSEHIGILFRIGGYDKTNKTTWSGGVKGGVEGSLDLGIGQTNLKGRFSKNYKDLTTFSGSSDNPYLYVALSLRCGLRNFPGYWGFNMKVGSSKVSKIKDSNGNIVYNPDGSRLTVNFTSFSLGGCLGFCF